MSPDKMFSLLGAMPPGNVEARISVERDGTVVARSGKADLGQGIRSGFAFIVAQELCVSPSSVRVELGETVKAPFDTGTRASTSTDLDGRILRIVAAYARHLLVERASAKLGITPTELVTDNGAVIAPNGVRLTYAELTADAPLTGTVPPNFDGMSRSNAADRPYRQGARALVTGAAKFPADVRLPGMLRGRALRPPVPTWEITSVDDSAARLVPGVVDVVRDGGFVGVVAERDEQALAALRALKVEWKRKPAREHEPIERTLVSIGDVHERLAGAKRVVRAAFHLPHISHAIICPSAAVADVRKDGADLHVMSQRPFSVRAEVASILNLPWEQVRVHSEFMGGMYGRGNVNDVALDATRLSKAVHRPVLVQWTRPDEFRFSLHRPENDISLEVALDDSGRIMAWRGFSVTNPHVHELFHEPVSAEVIDYTCGQNADPVYTFDAVDVRYKVVPGAIPTAEFRSLASSQNVFAIESFMDELASLTGQDPIEFRLRHTDDPRLRRVLERVRELSGWESRPREPGRGLGVACVRHRATYVAEVAETSVSPNGRVTVEQFYAVVDCGRLAHPDGARNQIEGGIQQASSWAVFEELLHRDGQVVSVTFQDYPIATFRDSIRKIEVELIENAETASTGVGEPGSAPAAAAIANSVFAACGARVRRLPLTPAAVLGAKAASASPP